MKTAQKKKQMECEISNYLTCQKYLTNALGRPLDVSDTRYYRDIASIARLTHKKSKAGSNEATDVLLEGRTMDVDRCTN